MFFGLRWRPGALEKLIMKVIINTMLGLRFILKHRVLYLE
ncbi:hypothetical protein D557_1675 [Bordetella holmesii 70147]|nr:hypothetical protein D560_2417 [Bordetella holmesii ATCC 51541]AIT27062.1 hypothetical protein D558_2401 [Bordetella holmesii 44057]EWM51813.1 hypothetical protein D557_1675 [Bordetella holmesii 70147]